MPLMPAFLRYPKEAAIIGRLVAGYGELEYVYANCLAIAIPKLNSAMRSYFSIVEKPSGLIWQETLCKAHMMLLGWKKNAY
jgi:hypothetical protein